MDISAVKAVFFSPTRTTSHVTREVADTIAADLSISVTNVNFTLPAERNAALEAAPDELLVIGVPVYMGRVPAIAADWLRTLRGNGAPAVCVAVYGNRAYEDALLELVDLVADCGCVPIAGGAFIGEHSFADEEAPIGLGRPEEDDLDTAVEFAKAVRDKLQAAKEPSALSRPEIPGNRPYGGRTEIWDVDFIAVSGACKQCGTCAKVCPVGAIDPADSAAIDIELCITCCACIKHCPQNARSMKPGPVMDAQTRLKTNFLEPKEPEYFV